MGVFFGGSFAHPCNVALCTVFVPLFSFVLQRYLDLPFFVVHTTLWSEDGTEHRDAVRLVTDHRSSEQAANRTL
jgi:hypothetical protein